MNVPEKKTSHTTPRFGLADVFFAVLAAAVGFFCAVNYSWHAGIFVSSTLLLFWHVREQRYAVVPGAAIGFLYAWATLRVNIDSETEMMEEISFFVAVGTSLNCLMFRNYVAGSLAILLVLIAKFIQHFTGN